MPVVPAQLHQFRAEFEPPPKSHALASVLLGQIQAVAGGPSAPRPWQTGDANKAATGEESDRLTADRIPVGPVISG